MAGAGDIQADRRTDRAAKAAYVVIALILLICLCLASSALMRGAFVDDEGPASRLSAVVSEYENKTEYGPDDVSDPATVEALENAMSGARELLEAGDGSPLDLAGRIQVFEKMDEAAREIPVLYEQMETSARVQALSRIQAVIDEQPDLLIASSVLPQGGQWASTSTEELRAAADGLEAMASAWHVSYYVDHLVSDADVSGAVTEWADRYYIAHDWSDGGKRISALGPGSVVEIDGSYYRYYDEWTIAYGSEDDHTDVILPWATSGSFIGMQTCAPNNCFVIKRLIEI